MQQTVGSVFSSAMAMAPINTHSCKSSANKERIRFQRTTKVSNDHPKRSASGVAPPSPFTRLYAQGVDLMHHRDRVFRQFGLRRASVDSTMVATAYPTKATAGRSRQGSQPQSTARVTTKARTASSSTSLSRPFSASYVSGSRPLSPTKFARTFSIKSTVESRSIVSPSKRQIRNKRTGPSKTSAIPKKQSTGSLCRSNTHSRSISTAHSYQMPQAKSKVSKSSSTQRKSEAISRHLNNSPSTTCKRNSIHNSSTPQCHKPDLTNSIMSSMGRADGGGGFVTAAATSSPILVQVSRRTSSPIISPANSAFGIRRRPSVSPIPSAASTGDVPMLPSAPRQSLYMRRDSKMERLVEQINILKASLGLSDEDLQWKVESAKDNAYLAAEKHLMDSEERYDRLIYEIQLLTQTPCEEVSTALVKKLRELIQRSQLIADMKSKLTVCHSDVAKSKKELMDAKIANELQICYQRQGDNITKSAEVGSDETPLFAQHVEEANLRLLQAQEQLTSEMAKLNELLEGLGFETERLAKACADFKFMSPEAAVVSNTLIHNLKCIPECSGEKLAAICEQAIQTTHKLKGSRAKDLQRKEADLAKAMKDLEIWRQRKYSAKEFPVEMAKREKQWKFHNSEENIQCLKLLRSLIPQDIHQLTIEGIIEKAAALGVLYTYDLAVYLKQNRCLHWLITHEHDIARDNFLAIECASFFANFVGYDIVELRALSHVLPEAFEFDKEGKKAEWKMHFMEHVYTLVKQQNGEKVKAGWDPIRNTRGEIQLQPLNAKQLLNALYRYPTEQEIQARIAKFELQAKRLVQKREKYTQLSDEAIPAAKTEYLALAEDARSEELQQVFGKATLIKLRDDSKQAYNALCKTRDALKSEIEHSEKIWNKLTPTYEQYLEEVNKIRQLDTNTRKNRIRGPFPGDIEVKPKERAAFKKLSAEEEAKARKLELDSAIAQREKGMSESVNVEAAKSETVNVRVEVIRSKDTAGSLVKATDMTNSATPVPEATDSSNAPQPGMFRKVKSLLVSVDVLRFLEQDFCSPTRGERGRFTAQAPPQSSSSYSRTATAGKIERPPLSMVRRSNSEQSILESNKSAPKETYHSHASTFSRSSGPARPKSKTLLQLMEKAKTNNLPSWSFLESNERASTMPSSPSRPGGNPFLSELQNRVVKKSSEAGDETNMINVLTPAVVISPPIAQQKQINFLDELRLVSKGKHKTDNVEITPPAAPVECRDADDTMVVESAALSLPPPPLPSGVAVKVTVGTPSVNFLDELRARTNRSVTKE